MKKLTIHIISVAETDYTVKKIRASAVSIFVHRKPRRNAENLMTAKTQRAPRNSDNTAPLRASSEPRERVVKKSNDHEVGKSTKKYARFTAAAKPPAATPACSHAYPKNEGSVLIRPGYVSLVPRVNATTP